MSSLVFSSESESGPRVSSGRGLAIHISCRDALSEGRGGSRSIPEPRPFVPFVPFVPFSGPIVPVRYSLGTLALTRPCLDEGVEPIDRVPSAPRVPESTDRLQDYCSQERVQALLPGLPVRSLQQLPHTACNALILHGHGRLTWALAALGPRALGSDSSSST